MKKLLNMTKRFAREDDGAAMVEYSILIGIVTAAAIAFIIAVGGYVVAAWSGLCSDINTASTPCTP